MIPNLEEARGLLKEYNKGDFHLLHGEVVSGIMGYFARQYDPENEEYWAARYAARHRF
jgi:predicted hydrolase (HD superfamily)